MSTIARNFAALLLSQVASWGVSAILILVVPRYLGDAQYGLLSFAGSFVGMFSLVAGLGVAPYLVKAIARDQALCGKYLFNALVIQVPLVLVLACLAIVIAVLIGYPFQTVFIISIMCLGMLFTTVNATFIAGLQGEQRMRRYAAWGVAQRYIGGGALLGVVSANKGVVWLALAQAGVQVIGVIANGWQLFRQLQQAARIDVRLCRTMLASSFPFFVWNVAFTIYGSIDVTMLSLMTTNSVVGWYALAYRLVGVPMFFPSLVMTALFPALSVQAAAGTPEFAHLANRTLCAVLLVCAPISVGIAITASDLLAFLHYPLTFMPSVPLIQILAIHIPVVGLTTVMGAVIMANDRQKAWAIVGSCASVINPALNLLAIPYASRTFANGAIGAAAVTVLTEGFMLIGALYLRPSGVWDRRTTSFVLRCAVASVPLAVVELALGGVPLLVRALLGVLIYGGMSLLLRTVTVQDVRRLGEYLLPVARLRSVSSVL